jgi:hypothetical protein
MRVCPCAGNAKDSYLNWWRNSGYHETGYEDVFYHDVPPGLAAEARRRERNESSKALKEPWPLTAWPKTPTRYLLCRDDRMFPAAWARRHAQERLGIEADQIDGGHYISLSRPRQLAQHLHAYAPPCSDCSRNGAASRPLLAPAKDVERLGADRSPRQCCRSSVVRRRVFLNRGSTRSRGGNPCGNPVVVTPSAGM